MHYNLMSFYKFKYRAPRTDFGGTCIGTGMLTGHDYLITIMNIILIRYIKKWVGVIRYIKKRVGESSGLHLATAAPCRQSLTGQLLSSTSECWQAMTTSKHTYIASPWQWMTRAQSATMVLWRGPHIHLPQAGQPAV